jgi:hypothetical protein
VTSEPEEFAWNIRSCPSFFANGMPQTVAGGHRRFEEKKLVFLTGKFSGQYGYSVLRSTTA